MTYGAPGGPKLIPFETEDDAVAHVEGFLRPLCVSLKREPQFANGLRPDLGFRLREAPDFPLLIECKKFVAGPIAPLISAIRQAHSYTELTGHVALVAPIQARGVMDLAWWASPIGSVGLLAGQFSVGYLFESPCREYGGIFVGGQAAAHFARDDNGDWRTRLHPKAQTLLARKHFSGSSTWRKAS